ncbi:hypothetical protein Ae717Ps2_2151 [Pseudonocardia sp. Ae717_Ps2]|nr:hypothetical protein Ae717Ps2_2151 [Pseudonocardia sp. Ae717_Ps2]
MRTDLDPPVLGELVVAEVAHRPAAARSVLLRTPRVRPAV